MTQQQVLLDEGRSAHETQPLAGDRRRSVLVVGVGWPMETFIDRLLSGLATRGISLTLMSKHPPSARWLEQRRATWRFGPDRLDLAQASRVARTRPAAIAPVAAELARSAMGKAKRHQDVGPVDVVYVPWISALVDHPWVLDQGVPVVTSCRGAQVTIAPWDPGRPGYADALRHVFASVTRVHCVSSAILDEAAGLGLDRERAVVITPAVEPSAFVPRAGARRDGPVQVLSVGSLIWRKEHEHALLAVRRALDLGADLRLRIIGDGPDRQHLRFAIADLGLEDHVELAGRRTPAEVVDELSGADVFLHTSVSEGISNAVLEAMAAGLPIVTTDAGGMAEAVRDGIDGHVVPVRDADATARRLADLAADPDRRDAMGRAARERIVSSFRLDQQIDAFVRLLDEAAATGG